MKVKAVLTINVHYDLNDTTIEEIQRILEDAGDTLANRGLLSDDTSAEVDTWDRIVNIKVKE